MNAVWGVLAGIGLIAFLFGALSADPTRVWGIYLVNLLFWGGLAVTGPAVAAMMQVTGARWSPSVRRIALTTSGFLPVAFILLLGLILGQGVLYGKWLQPPAEIAAVVQLKSAWLNAPFFWGRTLVMTLALFVVSFAFVRALLRDPVPPDDEREQGRRNVLAVILLALWLLTVSLWGFDLVMSIDPVWYSGLFGGYWAVTTLYTTFCLLSILTVSANHRGLASIAPAAVQDVAKLQFAFSIMWMYFFWSQYIVIWYGNVPVETRFFLDRFFVQPWLAVAWISVVMGWLIPFVFLLKRLTGRPPQRHAPLVVMAVFGLVAIFLERVLVVFPSVAAGIGFPGFQELLVTIGFLAAFLLARRWFFSRFKPVLNLPHTGH